MNHYDIIIVGAGMAGASLGAELADSASVLILEREAQPGYHTTGRSVAFWSESYGGPVVQPLTTASRNWLASPPASFSDAGFLSPRGEIHIARGIDEGAALALASSYTARKIANGMLDRSGLEAAIPDLRPGWDFGVLEPGTCDIDVARLHAAFLRKFNRQGGSTRVCADFVQAQRENGRWAVQAGGEAFSCDVLVNAAGAWADDIAVACGARPLGITPLRRSVVQLRTDPAAPTEMPLVMDLNYGFYFKPVGDGRVWLTPHDETPSAPCDAVPEELDIAVAIDRFQSVVGWRIEAVEHKWAGLRSFAPDRAPVYGFDRHAPGLFWFVGQGGFGIQTSPAAAMMAAALLTGDSMPDMVAHIDPARYSPARFG